MTISSFTLVLAQIEQTTLRNSITQLLADFFKSLSPEEIEASCWLLLGRVTPQYEGIEFQFAEKMMIRALAQVFSMEVSEVTALYKKSGDLGETAGILAEKKAGEGKLSLREVYEQLHALALMSGEGSQERKVTCVVELFKQLDATSIKFMVRIILTKLRLGFSDMTILDALSWAIKGDKSDRKILEDAYQNKHDIGKLAYAYLSGKEKALEHFEIELGIPIQPALCQRLKTPVEMIEKMHKIFAESKYDGTRVQIHIKNSNNSGHQSLVADNWKVRTFTRSLEESSAQFPELREAVDFFGEHDLILDCEAIGYDPKTGKLLPFQETIQRKRKHDIAAVSLRVPLRFFIFDVLYMDGKSLLSTPLNERKEILHALFSSNKKDEQIIFLESQFIVTESADELRDFHKAQLDAGLEGAVIKQYNSVYQPGRKGWSWVKFKEEETAKGKLSDTIDAVVMGYWYGKGKRTGFGIGAFLIGIMAHDDRILTLSKVGTGLSDEQWRELKRRTDSQVVVDMPKQYIVDKSQIPDVWVNPEVVVEVAGDELTTSSIHTAQVALRFPRLVRFRDDKKVDDITTKEELTAIR
jgi:DNA ligase 1